MEMEVVLNASAHPAESVLRVFITWPWNDFMISIALPLMLQSSILPQYFAL
jgi:hypothetical protein